MQTVGSKTYVAPCTCIETYALFKKQRLSYIEEYKRGCAVEPKAQKKVQRYGKWN